MDKDRHFLPHLTWPELEATVARTDVAIMPIGSIEQHGPALPLGTDTLLAERVAREAARRADAVCVPSTWVGLSSHHMAFPGSLTLSDEVFVRYVLEVAGSLARHGFRKILLYNGHGGNEAAMAYLVDRITKTTGASAALFGIAELRKIYLGGNAHLLDIHAGINETSGVLAAYPELVVTDAIERPTMRLEPHRTAVLERVSDDPSLLRYATLGLPDVHEISSNGCITLGDPRTATAERGHDTFRRYVDAVVAFIDTWRSAVPRST